MNLYAILKGGTIMKQLLFASDLDGTLLNAAHETDEEILTGMQELARQNAAVAVSTGRSVSMCRSLGFPPGPKVLMNGALALDAEDRVVYDQPLPAAIVAELMDLFPDLPFEFCTSDCTLTRQSRQETIGNFQRRWAKRGKPRRNADFDKMFQGHRNDQTREQILDQTIYKINCNREDSEDCRRLETWLAAHPEVVNTPSDEVLYEISAASATKGLAVQALAGHLGIPHDQVAVFGDGINDLSMFELFAHSYAPSTGQPEVQAAASEVLDGSDEHCVIRKMKELREQWQ